MRRTIQSFFQLPPEKKSNVSPGDKENATPDNVSTAISAKSTANATLAYDIANDQKFVSKCTSAFDQHTGEENTSRTSLQQSCLKEGENDLQPKEVARKTTLSTEQLQVLEQLFETQQYPSTKEKNMLAEQLGIAGSRVSKWFEKRRSKKRAGDYSSQDSKKKAKPTDDLLAPIITDAGAEASKKQDDAHLNDSNEQPTNCLTTHQQVNLYTPVANDIPEQHSQQNSEIVLQDSANMQDGGPNTVQPAAVISSAVCNDQSTLPADQPRAGNQSLPAGNCSTACAQPDTQTTPATQHTTEPSKTDAATVAQTAGPYDLSDRKQLVTQLKLEIKALRTVFLTGPLVQLEQEQTSTTGQLERSKVAMVTCGSILPLSQLLEGIWGHLSNNAEHQGITKNSVRDLIIDVATRKSYATASGSASCADAFEDDSADKLWVWELRDAKILPKELQPKAIEMKRKRQKAHEHMCALHNAMKVLEKGATGKVAEQRLMKALQKVMKTQAQLDKAAKQTPKAAAHPPTTPATELKTPGAVASAAPSITPTTALGEQQTVAPGSVVPITGPSTTGHAIDSSVKEDTVATNKSVDLVAMTANERKRKSGESDGDKKGDKEVDKKRKEAEKEGERQRKEAEKEAERKRKEAEKEVERKTKEEEKETERQEKERQKVEKEAERERERQEKEARKRKEKEEKAVKATGFKSVKALEKTRNTFMNFFQPKTPKTPQAAPTPPPADTSDTRMQQFRDAFRPPAEQFRLPPRESKAHVVDAWFAAPQSNAKRAQLQRQMMAEWKSKRPKRKRSIGLPPSWACRRNAEEVLEAVQRQKYGECCRVEGIRTWRRKFIWFQADSKRPPYYGSYSRTFAACGPRNPLGKEDEVDYEVLSDQDWEEEPEGENLEDNDKDDEERVMDEDEESEDDSFVVADGYLSEDEGVDGVAEQLDVPGEDDDGIVDSAAAASHESEQAQRARAQLEALLDRARRNNRPLIINNLGGSSTEATATSGEHIKGDVALLGALGVKVLNPNVQIVAPPTTGRETSADGMPKPDAKSGEKLHSVAAARTDPTEVLPELIKFMLDHPEMRSVPKVAAAFVESHKDKKLFKKRVVDQIKEIAVHVKGGWKVKHDTLEAAGIHAPEAAVMVPHKLAIAATPGTPVPSHTPTAGPLERFLGKTPLVPMAKLGAAATPMSCLAKVSTGCKSVRFADQKTVEGKARPPLPSVDPSNKKRKANASLDGSGTPRPPCSPPSATSSWFWQQLCDDVTAGLVDPATDHRFTIFGEDELLDCVAYMPACLVSALVKAYGTPTAPAARRAAFARCLANVACALNTGDSTGKTHPPHQAAPEAAQQLWAHNRSAPVAASLAELCAEPGLMDTLQRALLDADKDVAKVTARLLSALMMCGNPSRPSPAVGGVGLLEETVEHMEGTAGPGGSTNDNQPPPAATLRLKFASSVSWLDAVCEQLSQHSSQSACAGYTAQALSHVLFDEASRRKLGDTDATHLKLLRLLCQHTLVPQKGVSKYCIVGLLLVLRDTSLTQRYLTQDQTGTSLRQLVECASKLVTRLDSVDQYLQACILEVTWLAIRGLEQLPTSDVDASSHTEGLRQCLDGLTRLPEGTLQVMASKCVAALSTTQLPSVTNGPQPMHED